MVTVRIDSSDLQVLTDPQLIARAEARMLERGVDILQPLARAEAPTRSGRGKAGILGVVERVGSRLVGRVHAGKAYWLRILATGQKAHEIRPFRFRRSSRKARTAARALGPGRARGAIRSLRFQLGGQVLFRGSVQHPGLKPDPFFERAAKRGESQVIVAAEQVVADEFRRVA